MFHLSPGDLPALGGAFAAASVCVGWQRVAKGRDRDDARNLVEVLVANVRLEAVGTDLLVTLNRPLVVAQGSSAAPQTGAGVVGVGGFGSGVDGGGDGPGSGGGDGGPGWAVLRGVLRSLTVHEWGLFG